MKVQVIAMYKLFRDNLVKDNIFKLVVSKTIVKD